MLAQFRSMARESIARAQLVLQNVCRCINASFSLGKPFTREVRLAVFGSSLLAKAFAGSVAKSAARKSVSRCITPNIPASAWCEY